MRRCILFIGFLLLVSPIFSQRFAHNHYQIFRDDRYSDIYYRMFWTGVLNETQVLMGLRSLNRRTGGFHNFLAFIEKTNSRSWTIIQIEGDNPGVHSEHRQILDDMRDLLRVAAMYGSISTNHGFGSGTVQQQPRQIAFNNEVHIAVHNSLLPIFSIRSIRPASEVNPIYTLYQTGSIEFENQSEFFSLVPVIMPTISSQRSISQIPTSQPRNLGPLIITLDRRWNWTKERPTRAEFSQTMGTVEAWIEVERITPQTRVGMKLWNPNDLNSYFLAHRPGVVFAESLDTSGFQEYNRLMFLGYNASRNFQFYSYYVFLFGEDMYVMNFVVQGDLYQQNIQYFRSILDSVRLLDSL